MSLINFDTEEEIDINFTEVCCRRNLITGIFQNMGHIELILGQKELKQEQYRFLKKRLNYYEELLRELTNLETRSKA